MKAEQNKIVLYLKIGFMYIIPMALVSNWVLDFHWSVGENCIDALDRPVQTITNGFPFPSMLHHMCNDACWGSDYMALGYWFIFLNGFIKLVLSFILYYFLLKKVRLNYVQTGLWLFISYFAAGAFLYYEFKDLQNCGRFEYTQIASIQYSYFHLFYRISDLFSYGAIVYWYVTLSVLLTFVFLAWLDHKKKQENVSNWWMLFYLFWILLFASIIFCELFFYRYDDQMITSSGDHTYRQEWYSIIIGYILVIVGFIYSKKIISKSFMKGILGSILIFGISALIIIKNQHCIVLGTSGMRFVEFYTPFYKSEYIGDFMEGANNPLVDLGEGEWKNKNITKIHTEANSIIFTRPLCKDYNITKQFIFWRFNFPDEFHD